MNEIDGRKLEELLPACRRAVGRERWDRLVRALPEGPNELLPEVLSGLARQLNLPEYLPELARLELDLSEMEREGGEIPLDVERPTVNPTLRVVNVGWKNLCAALDVNRREGETAEAHEPEPGGEMVMLWRGPRSLRTYARPATDEDLLALKLAVEGIAPKDAARAGGVPPVSVHAALDRGARSGVIVMPLSRIRRPEDFPRGDIGGGEFLVSDVFTLQWHVTQACDLHCKHCYDRSARASVELGQGLRLLDDLEAFAEEQRVMGRVSFSGGNPLLHPDLAALYRGASERGFEVAVLGNPAERARVEELLNIQMPAFYQVSLEGLAGHNDRIRGEGHFRRTVEFLRTLGELGVFRMVMLTLTRDNMCEVIPLARELRGLAESFNFNRLSPVGEGAALALPDPGAYEAFLGEYLEAADEDPAMRLKDNLFNILLQRLGREPFGGCTGFGCGAGFNFLTVLSDGEAHACRKFPSPLGNVHQAGIAAVYDSEAAALYRRGCEACARCAVRAVCGGCLAMAHGFGRDIFAERDPFCFMEEGEAVAADRQGSCR